MPPEPDPLDRFVTAQAACYEQVLRELRSGQKQSHWMWFIFPQLTALGRSHTAQFYGLADLAAARAYLAHPLLGARLRECTGLLLDLPGQDARALLGSPDDLKLRSCMTLFGQVAHEPAFAAVLHKYYGDQPDPATLALVRAAAGPNR